VTAHLLVAYFKSQRTGRAPHSPKNCLPGSGWVKVTENRISIPIAGRPPIEANRYIVQKGESKSLVLYWYQSRDRVVASEYTAKYYVVADALRYNRTDTALVRVVIPITENGVEAIDRAAVDFVQSFFAPLRQHFPA
jgi:EpsI family protein